MATEIVSNHYVVTVKVERVQHIRTTLPDGPRMHDRTERKVGTVVNLNLTGKHLGRTLVKAIKHLELTDDQDGDIVLETDHSGKR